MVAPTIPGHNQEATLYLQELASTLPIQRLVQAHLTGNTLHDYQGFHHFSQSVGSLRPYPIGCSASLVIMFFTGL